MDPVSVRMTRTSLLWLVFGFSLGALMLSDRLVPGDWRLWFSPTHGHVLFVGWFLQFAIGVAYWLLPRQRSDAMPRGYREDVAWAAYLLLNAGLALRVVFEPIGRERTLSLVDWALAVSAILQLAAVVLIAGQLWGRLVPRQRRERPTLPDA